MELILLAPFLFLYTEKLLCAESYILKLEFALAGQM